MIPAREQDAARARRARILILALTIAVGWACAPYLAGLLGGVVLAVVCAPAYARLRARLGDRAAALGLTLAAAALLIAPAVWLVATVVEQAPAALRNAESSAAFARLRDVHLGTIDIGAQLGRVGDEAVARLTQWAPSLFGGLTRATLNLLLALVGLYYLLLSGNLLWAQLRPLIPFSRRAADVLAERFVSVTEATLLGIAVTAAAQAAVVGLSFALVGLPNVLVWSAMTAVVSILPVLGSALVWGPGVVVLLVAGRYGAALVLFLLGFVVASNIDNVLRPLVNRRVSGLHPMVTLVGAFAGMELLGLPGLLLGPLAIAYGIELVRLYREEYGPAESERRSVRASAASWP